MVSREQVIEMLKAVEDPELGLDIWTLGLIYAIDIAHERLKVTMTFTSPMCPYGPVLMDMIKEGGQKIGFKIVDIEITFNPVWQPTEEVKMLLGIA